MASAGIAITRSGCLGSGTASITAMTSATFSGVGTRPAVRPLMVWRTIAIARA